MSPDIAPSLRDQAEACAGMHGCPRCQGFTIVEKTYSMTGPLTEKVWQFRCLLCGWCDDLRFMGELQEREVLRQAQRSAAGRLRVIEKEETTC